MKSYKESDTEDMALHMKRFLLGYLEMWIFSTRLVLTFWFVTIGMFWSLTFGTMVDLKNNHINKPVGMQKKVYTSQESLAVRNAPLKSDQCSNKTDKL